ncbi:MAG TPA: hypothetical protein GXX58_02460 [Gelria sp.]|jgi:hypothetical protein|nr:hypothetical protein [Gelria sp.]
MLGIKLPVSGKGMVLVLAFILLITLLMSKNSQALMRFMVGQEVDLKTANFDQYQSEHYDIRYTPVDEPYIKLIAGTAEEAYDAVSAMFGVKPSGRTVLVVYPDSSSLSQSFGWDKDASAMGVYWAGSIRILSPREWLGEQDMQLHFAREGPMVHEFAHLMVDELSQGNYNRWWTEGIAQYVEKKITGFEFSSPFAGDKKVEYYQLKQLAKRFDELEQSIVYWESLQAVEYIADCYGEASLFDITRQLGQGKSLEQAIEKILAIPYTEWEEGFYQHIMKQV